LLCFFFSSRRRHTRFSRDWSSDVCSSDLLNTVLSFGKVNSQLQEQFLMLGYDDLKPIQYFKENLNPWWKDASPGQTIEMQLDLEIGRASCRERVRVSGRVVLMKN